MPYFYAAFSPTIFLSLFFAGLKNKIQNRKFKTKYFEKNVSESLAISKNLR